MVMTRQKSHTHKAEFNVVHNGQNTKSTRAYIWAIKEMKQKWLPVLNWFIFKKNIYILDDEGTHIICENIPIGKLCTLNLDI